MRLPVAGWLFGLAISLLGFLVLLTPALALARPGGGDLFDGGSHGSGSDGGGDVDIGLVIDLVILCVRYPALGGVVVVGVVVYAVVKKVSGAGLKDWSAGVPPGQVEAARSAGVARSALDGLRTWDPEFSVVLLEDFLYALYAEVQQSRGRGGLVRLAAFVSPEVIQALTDPALDAVTGVIIGSMRLNELHVHADRVELGADFETNFTEVRGTEQRRLFAVDRLHFVRSRSARSRPPARSRKLDCPNCGAPLEGMRGTTCGYCHQEVGGGRLDWAVTSIRRLRTEDRPKLFSETVAERGNELPTRVDAGLNVRLAELQQRDPAFDMNALWARIGLVFHELSLGWSGRDLPRVRGYVSDNLFQYFAYFIDLYLRERARNVTENARILRVDLANVLTDAYYDAITVRLFATGLDYTLSDDGKLLTGSRSRERAYSEYWTLIRGRYAKGRARTEPTCPNCGAPLKVGMAGNCEYCQARVVTGDFDWVLSRIEQDEVYTG